MNPFMINRFGLCAVLLTVFSLHSNAQATGSAVDLSDGGTDTIVT